MDGFCLVETEHQEVMGGFSSILGVMAVFCLVDPQLFIETHNFVADPQIFIGDPNKFYIKLVVSNYNLRVQWKCLTLQRNGRKLLGFKGEKVFENPSVLYCCFLNIQGVQLNMTMDWRIKDLSLIFIPSHIWSLYPLIFDLYSLSYLIFIASHIWSL